MSWYYVDPKGEAQGPTTINALKSLYGSELKDDTFIWNGTTVHQWTALNKVPSIHKQLSSHSVFMGTLNRLNTMDIDSMLDEIDATEQKEKASKSKKLKKYKSKQNKNKTKQKKTDSRQHRQKSQQQQQQPTINWNQIYLHTQSIMNLVESDSICINIQNPSDGMTLLMHSIIIGDYDLVLKITNYGADISIKDNDGDDALDYALVFQRYKITELLLGLSKNGIKEAIANQNEMAKYMTDAQFGRFKHKIVHFVTRAIKERKAFDINLLYYAWYFTLNGTDRSPVSSTSQSSFSSLSGSQQSGSCQDPLQTKLFKTMMKAYWDIISNKSSDKTSWRWLRKHFINSLIWYLPHPNHASIDDINALNFDHSDCNNANNAGKDVRKMLSFLFL